MRQESTKKEGIVNEIAFFFTKMKVMLSKYVIFAP